MDNFGKVLKRLRDNNNVSAMKFAEDLNVHRGSVSNWETGRRMPDAETLTKIGKYFNVSVDYLLGNDNKNKTDDAGISNIIEIDSSKMIKIPVIGVIKAGVPMLADENIIDYEFIHQEEISVGEEYFYLEIQGDSMINARIFEGDRVLIKKQNFIENNGDIYAVRVNGDEATLKRVYRQEKGIMLVSENLNYPPMFYPASDLESGYVGVIGRAVEVKIKL